MAKTIRLPSDSPDKGESAMFFYRISSFSFKTER
jgi:hypothetical protein